ncbi:hypothetical protein GQ56_0119210 [Burkholderia paludis]|nr:hypothetical protein GQ56_0119210 [Burkholderia paludis]
MSSGVSCGAADSMADAVDGAAGNAYPRFRARVQAAGFDGLIVGAADANGLSAAERRRAIRCEGASRARSVAAMAPGCDARRSR